MSSVQMHAMFCLVFFAGGFALANDLETNVQPAAKNGKGTNEATHKQSRVLAPTHGSNKIVLNTYCLAPSGDLLLCVGGPWDEHVLNPNQPGDYEIKHHDVSAFIQKYSPEGDLIAEYPIDFKPTGINMMPGGKEFVVAGEGWIARLNLAGEVVKKSRTAQVGDFEKFKTEALAAAKADARQQTGQLEKMVEQAEQALAKLEETPESARTPDVKAQITAQQTQLKQFKSLCEQVENRFGAGDAESAARSRLTVTGVAVTEKDIFVSVRKLKGHGYEVWRTDHDFANGERVVEDLGGCCGQLDIQPSGGNLLVAENGKFRVGIYDRDGEMTKSFGKRDRKSAEGFGSCCNPMNVRCCSNGEILTAESSIGDIKRFSASGDFLGYVGRAKIGGGCKHVAIEYDAARNRYYMQHQDKNYICVLVPLAEITGLSEDELLAKAAREGLGVKLIGAWSIPQEGKAKPKRKGMSNLIGNVFGDGSSNSRGVADQLTFEEDGNLSAIGGQLGQYSVSNQLEWRAIQQKDNAIDVAIVMDGVETFNLRVTFNKDDSTKIELRYDEGVMATGTYERKKAASPSNGDDNKSAND